MPTPESAENQLRSQVHWTPVNVEPPHRKWYQLTPSHDEFTRFLLDLHTHIDAELQENLNKHGLTGEREVTLLALAEGLSIDAELEQTRVEVLGGLVTYEKMKKQLHAWAGGTLRFSWQHNHKTYISEVPLIKLQIGAMDSESNPNEAENPQMSFTFNKQSLVRTQRHDIWSKEIANYTHPNMYLQGNNLTMARLMLPSEFPNLETSNPQQYLSE